MMLMHERAVQGVVTVGDYDGVVSQMHLESGHFIADIDDHGGSRYDTRLCMTYCNAFMQSQEYVQSDQQMCQVLHVSITRLTISSAFQNDSVSGGM